MPGLRTPGEALDDVWTELLNGLCMLYFLICLLVASPLSSNFLAKILCCVTPSNPFVSSNGNE